MNSLLEISNYNNTDFLNIKGDYMCKAVRVFDGDTIVLLIDYPEDQCSKIHCRLSGIDCPEMSDKNLNIKKLAINARNFLVNQITDLTIDIDDNCSYQVLNKKLEQNNKIFNCRIDDTDKYGRYLVNLFVDNQCINKLMVDSTHAVEYDGKTKKLFCESSF